MNHTNHTKEQAREFLKQEALKEIRKVSDFRRFQDRVFCVLAKYGLQLNAKEEEEEILRKTRIISFFRFFFK